MYCRNCGNEFPENAKFCGKCGRPIVLQTKRNRKKRTFLWIPILIIGIGIATAGIFYFGQKIQDHAVADTSDLAESEDDDINIEPSSSVTDEVEALPETSENVEEETTSSLPETDIEEDTGYRWSDFNVGQEIYLPIEVQASSELSGGDYDVHNLTDDDYSTAWVEGSEGVGMGENITITNLNPDQPVCGIAIAPGYQKNENVFFANAMPTSLTVRYGDEEKIIDNYQRPAEEAIQQGSTYMYLSDFKEPVLTDEIKVTITGVREGTKYEDTCISGLWLYTYQLNE